MVARANELRCWKKDLPIWSTELRMFEGFRMAFGETLCYFSKSQT
jgi:hypothetical protein